MELDFILSKEEEKAAGKTELIYDLVIIGGGPAGMTAAVSVMPLFLKERRWP